MATSFSLQKMNKKTRFKKFSLVYLEKIVTWNVEIIPLEFAQNQNMGNIKENSNWKNRWMGSMAMGKCEGRHENYFHTQTNYKHFQGRYGGLQFGYVYTCNELFQRTCKFKKLVLEHFFTNLLNNLSIEDLVTLRKMLSTKFMKPRRRLYATPNKRTWVPQELKNKMLN